MAAHELRTPVQRILGLSEVLLSKEGNIEQYHEVITATTRNAKRLQRLTEDILDVTRIESRTLKLHKEKVDVSEKISNAINEIKNHISSTDKLRMVFAEPIQSLYVKEDKTRPYEILANLLSNAIKFTKKGTISISTDVNDNNYVIIAVKDTGEGINSEIAPRFFTKFTTTSDVGTGLGLYLSKSIVEAHGGIMWAENNPDGKGATFSFTLPRVSNDTN
ncbi:MAG: HAMP domain-containing sensor histidine kinase [Nitrososphaeraceae archaeon]